MVEEVGIRLSVKDRRAAAAELEATERSFDELGQAAEDAGKQAETSGKRFERTKGILRGIGGVALGFAKAAGVAAVAGAAVGIKTAAAMQTAKIGFTTMLGSGKAASRFLRDLSSFAAKTPFEFPELQTAASRLVSAGVETRKVIPIMTTLGDVTAGMGTGSEGITRATNALQQMTAAGRISAEDLNQLRDAGIPVYDLLAKALGKSKEEVIALKDEGKLGGDALVAMMRALETGKGLERFNGLMEKQSKSLGGRFSTLKDTVNMGLADAVKPAVPLIGRLLGLATTFAESAMPKIRDGVEVGVTAVKRLIKGFQGGGGVEGALATLSAPGIPKSAGQIGDAVGKVGDAIAGVDWDAVKSGLGEGFADTISVSGVVIGFLADHLDELAKYLPFVIAGFAAWKVAQAAGNVVQLAAVPLTVAQTVSNFALAGAMRAQTAATVGATVAQKGLNKAFLMSPLGLLIAGIMLVVGGFILLYKKSDTFRGLVDTIWNSLLKPFAQWLGGVLLDGIVAIASGLLRMGEFGVKAFRILVTSAFMTFDGILRAAEAGLGWIPGIGDKISGAREAFNRFGDGVINKLAGVEAKLRSTREQVDQLARDRSATINITTAYTTLGSPTRGRGGVEDFGGAANGGHVKARRPYIVGERRAELFVPSVSGRIIPRVPNSPADLADVDPGAFDGTPVGRRGPTVVQIQLDGRTIAEAVLDEIDDAGARR